MNGRRTVVFLGAPTAKEAMDTWKGDPIPQTDDISSLPPFQIDPQQSKEIAWRHLTDPVDSLSQEFADLQTRTLNDIFLERSLRVYDADVGDNESEMDLDPVDYSEVSISQIASPFLTGYDFDVNEITELEDLPMVSAHNFRQNYSIVVAVQDISPVQIITTKYGKSIPLVKLIVADQTVSNFEIACWEAMATVTQSMRINDIIHFRDLGLSEFRGVVSAATRRKSRVTMLYRCQRLTREDDAMRPRLDLEDQQTRIVRRLRDWVLRNSWGGLDEPPTLETQELM